MPPKAKFTKEEVIAAALALTREQGMAALTARGLAARLGSSPKPIFGLFSSMEEIQQAVIAEAGALFSRRMGEEIASGKYPAYKASGMAYIRFAQEEKELFKLLYMRDRRGKTPEKEDPDTELVLRFIQKATGLSRDSAWLLHLEMWIYVHGIATMLATSYLQWDPAFVSRSLTDVYEGLKIRFVEGEANERH